MFFPRFNFKTVPTLHPTMHNPLKTFQIVQDDLAENNIVRRTEINICPFSMIVQFEFQIAIDAIGGNEGR